MKIGILMPLGEQRGGAELMFLQLMQHGRCGSIEWSAIFLEDGPLRHTVEALGITTNLVRAGRLRQPVRFCRTVAGIARVIKRMKLGAIISWMPKAHLYGSFAAMLAGVPALWFQHGIASSPLDRCATILPSPGVLASSLTIARAQERLFPHRRVRTAYPGVNLADFDRAALGSKEEVRICLGLPTAGPLIGMVGRLQRWKGMHVLLSALPKVLKSHPNLHCLIVGGTHDGEPCYKAELDALALGLGIEKRICFAGLQQNVADWMQAMDVVVHASDREPFGIVVLEAMALGKPVIAGDSGGPTEIIKHAVNGLLSPFGDSERLAENILRILDQPEFAQSLGAAAWKTARQFSVQRYSENLTAAVLSLLNAEPVSKVMSGVNS